MRVRVLHLFLIFDRFPSAALLSLTDTGESASLYFSVYSLQVCCKESKATLNATR